MTTSKKDESKPEKTPEATALLRADHKLVAGLFEEFEQARSASKKKALVAQI